MFEACYKVILLWRSWRKLGGMVSDWVECLSAS